MWNPIALWFVAELHKKRSLNQPPFPPTHTTGPQVPSYVTTSRSACTTANLKLCNLRAYSETSHLPQNGCNYSKLWWKHLVLIYITYSSLSHTFLSYYKASVSHCQNVADTFTAKCC